MPQRNSTGTQQAPEESEWNPNELSPSGAFLNETKNLKTVLFELLFSVSLSPIIALLLCYFH